MLLNGKRLGNLERDRSDTAIRPSSTSATAQQARLGEAIAGELVWTRGSRDGVRGTVRRTARPTSLIDCFIGRFGWLGDRASLEDQVANAAFVEMNMTSTQGLQASSTATARSTFPIRYAYPNCGPANKMCVDSRRQLGPDRDATSSGWPTMRAGSAIPTRSEFQVALHDVIAGEKVFKQPASATPATSSTRIDIDRSGRHDADTSLTATVWRRASRHARQHTLPVVHRHRPADARHGLPVAGRGRGPKSNPRRERRGAAGIPELRAEDPHAGPEGHCASTAT